MIVKGVESIVAGQVLDVSRSEGFETFNANFPLVKDKIEALTTGLVPDHRGFALLAMNEGVAYSKEALYEAFCQTVGCRPYSAASIFGFCDGYNGRVGPLRQLGAVKLLPGDDPRLRSYAVTDFGTMLKPVIMNNTSFVNGLQVDRNAKNVPGYSSLFRVVGPATGNGDAHRGVIVYEIFNRIRNDITGDVTAIGDIAGDSDGKRRIVSKMVNSLGDLGLLRYDRWGQSERDSVGKRFTWERKSSIRPNHFTYLAWENLFQPIGEIAEVLQRGCVVFNGSVARSLEEYRGDREAFMKKVHDHMALYMKEKGNTAGKSC